MELTKLICACAILFMLPACASVGPIGRAAVSTQPITGSTVLDEKALFAAEAIYNVPAKAYVVAHGQGLVSGTLKAMIKPKLQTMRKVLLSVRTAYRLGDASGFNARVAQLRILRDEITPLLPSG